MTIEPSYIAKEVIFHKATPPFQCMGVIPLSRVRVTFHMSHDHYFKDGEDRKNGYEFVERAAGRSGGDEYAQNGNNEGLYFTTKNQ